MVIYLLVCLFIYCFKFLFGGFKLVFIFIYFKSYFFLLVLSLFYNSSFNSIFKYIYICHLKVSILYQRDMLDFCMCISQCWYLFLPIVKKKSRRALKLSVLRKTSTSSLLAWIIMFKANSGTPGS